MARKRMIDPSFWDDLNVAKLSIAARLCFIGMVSNADDDGRIEADPRYIKRAVFGFDDELSSIDVAGLLAEIEARCPSVVFYEVDGRALATFLNWRRYQYIQKPQPSRLPAPPLPDEHDIDTLPVSPSGIEKNRKRIEQRESAQAREDTPSPPPPPDDDPIAAVYEETFERPLNADQCAYLAARVTDIPRWRQCCEDWKLNGYKPSNLVGLLDRYSKPPDAPPGPARTNGNVSRRGPPVGEKPELSEAEIKVKFAARKAELLKGLPPNA